MISLVWIFLKFRKLILSRPISFYTYFSNTTKPVVNIGPLTCYLQAAEIRKQIAEKTAVLESELFKGKRKEEDLLAYKRKLDRHKKDNPLSTTIDEVTFIES